MNDKTLKFDLSDLCFACGRVGHASANGFAMVLTEHGERKPYRVCPFVGSHPWGDTVAPNDKKCGRCGFANFRYCEYSSDGIRGYRCVGCGAIKPDGSSARRPGCGIMLDDAEERDEGS